MCVCVCAHLSIFVYLRNLFILHIALRAASSRSGISVIDDLKPANKFTSVHKIIASLDAKWNTSIKHTVYMPHTCEPKRLLNSQKIDEF